jgi:hypothetical protein
VRPVRKTFNLENISMKFKKLVIWWLVTRQDHPQLTEKDKRIESLMPLVEALFPGINYYSSSGFSEVMQMCAMPALAKHFPELALASSDDIARDTDAEVEITAILPSNGYEWQGEDWHTKFKELLAA